MNAIHSQVYSEWKRCASLLAREEWLNMHGRSVAAQTVLAVDTQKLSDDMYRGRIDARVAVRLIASSRRLMHRNQTRALLGVVHALVGQYR